MEWIKCSDRMPTDVNQNYLTVIKDNPKAKPKVCGWIELAHWNGRNEPPEWVYEDICNNTCCISEDDISTEVTHWMPYPKPPKEEDENDFYIQMTPKWIKEIRNEKSS